MSQSTFNGLDLAPDCFAYNINCLLKAAILLQMSDDETVKMIGGEVLDIARDYAHAAASKECGGSVDE